MSDPLSLPLRERLELTVQAWLQKPIDAGVDPDGRLERARLRLAGLTKVLTREEDGPITPETDQVKLPRLILAASDEGRTVAYAPIRNLRLRLVLRSNAQTDVGAADPFLADCGALETLLEGINLKEAWDANDFQIAVMLAVRKGANARGVNGSIRTEVFHVDVRAVSRELTTS